MTFSFKNLSRQKLSLLKSSSNLHIDFFNFSGLLILSIYAVQKIKLYFFKTVNQNGNLGFVIQINDFDRPFFGRFEKQNGRNWLWIKVRKVSFYPRVFQVLIGFDFLDKKNKKNYRVSEFSIFAFSANGALHKKAHKALILKVSLNLKLNKNFSWKRNLKIWNNLYYIDSYNCKK